MKEAVLKIKEYILMLNPQIEENNLEFYIEELLDRVLIFTNRKKIPVELFKVLAKSYVEDDKRKTEIKEAENGEIASISDNGQSMSFRSKTETYKNNNSDFFEDLKPILEKYRIGWSNVVGE